MTTRKIFARNFKYLLAVVLVLFAITPFIWVVSTSFNNSRSIMGSGLIPRQFTLANYVNILSSESLNFSKWMFNSLKVSAISVFFIVVITCITAYALARFHFRGKKGFMLTIMVLNVFPAVLGMVALYQLIQQLGFYIPWLGLNTHGGLILVYVAGSMGINTLMVKSYIDTIAVELDESAIMEGATYWQTFWKIVFPVIRPIVITIGILAVMSTYGDFVIANVLIRGNDKSTVMVGIFQFTQQRFDTDWGQVTAGTVMAGLPIIVLFFMTQKYILNGLTTGAVKE